MCTGQAAERPPKIPVATASPTVTPLTMPAVTVATLVAEDDQVAARVASWNVPSLICASSRTSADCPTATESRGCGRQASASATGGPMVTVTGAEETGTPVRASVALATRVMVLPAAAPAVAETEKVEPTVGRDPETLEGEAVTEATVRVAGFCTVAGPAVAAGGVTAVPAFASVPEAEAVKARLPLPATE